MARGLPSNFVLDLPPDDGPVQIGDFLDEPPPVHSPRKVSHAAAQTAVEQPEIPPAFTPRIVPDRQDTRASRVPPAQSKVQPARVLRCQLNLTPKSEGMLNELMEHVKTYTPHDAATASEVFQGLIGLLHGAIDDLDLSNLPRRGAWGSVTARNFPGALGESFEQAVVRSARKRRIEG